MCIRDRGSIVANDTYSNIIQEKKHAHVFDWYERRRFKYWICLLYTSDAADERSSVDLGGRRIIKKKKYQ